MNDCEKWPLASRTLNLGPDEVHIWCARLDLPQNGTSELLRTLSQDEQNRAARFVFPEDRRKYIAARGILRNILSRYLDRVPGDVRFAYGPYGKPTLKPESGALDIHFSLSHADCLALYALTLIGEIGIDHERVQSRLAYEIIAKGILQDEVASQLRALPVKAQPSAFFKYWTGLEASLKARGLGLAHGLDDGWGHMSAEPSVPVAGMGPYKWSLRLLAPAREFLGAVAVPKESWRQVFWKWDAPSIPDGNGECGRGLFNLDWRIRAELPDSDA